MAARKGPSPLTPTVRGKDDPYRQQKLEILRMAENMTLIVDAPLIADSVFAGRYRIERVIARGERKWTYLASDMRAGGHRQVALAVLESGSDSAASQREVEMMGKVGQHDCIVTLHDFDLDSASPYLVFEYLPGGRLRDHCRDLQARGSPVPLTDFFRTARQLCRALAHVHGRGVIHRDVAATNILLDERGVAHLGDFDTAVSRQEPPAVAALVPLTPEGFAAPELTRGAALDHRADLYALGAVLYELLVGAVPPVGESPAQVPPSQWRQDVPPRLDTLILSMLAADRKDRPHSAQAVLDELRNIESTADLELLRAGGESASLEFKQTMRWDTQLHKSSADVLKASVKTVCAFLNTGGGTLLIGVAATGESKGLEDDLQSFSDGKTTDNFERKFRVALSNSLDPEPNQLVMLSFPSVSGTPICRVDVSSSPRPVFLVAKGRPAEFFVRKGNASPPLTDVMQAFEYIHDHWR
jgi:serine/threonine protein kinase